MSDLERMKNLYDDLGVAYRVSIWKDEDKGLGIECKELTLGTDGGWYWTVFQFKDGKYVDYYITE